MLAIDLAEVFRIEATQRELQAGAVLHPTQLEAVFAGPVKARFADSRQFVASSKAEALRLATFIRPMDEYALVEMATDAPVVTVWTAQSQSLRAMGKDRFKASKDGVLAAIETMLDLQPGTLGKQREAA
jgi:hypothetical protein